MRRRVLVTGAGSGFGLATALLLGALGFEVIGLVPDDGESRVLGRAAEERGLAVETVVADLSDPARRAGLVSGLGLWGLVNNAGYMGAGEVRDVAVDDARRQLETMVLAPVDLVRQTLPSMIELRQGRIVNVTSSALHTNTPLTGWYTACKAALRQLNDSLRVELAGCGVDVIDIEPGGYRTGIWDRAAGELQQRRRAASRPDLYDRVLRHLRRAETLMGEPGHVALAVADVLTTGRPPRHKRIGPGAGLLRIADRIVPDRAWDRRSPWPAGSENLSCVKSPPSCRLPPRRPSVCWRIPGPSSAWWPGPGASGGSTPAGRRRAP